MSARIELAIYFTVGLLFTLCVPAIFPSLKLFYFIPFLIRGYYLRPFKSCLWMAFWVGLVLDLLSAHSRFGLYSANYVLTTALLFRLKRNFFEDSFTTIPVLTFFFSILSSMIQMLLLLIFDRELIAISWEFAFTDLFLMPLLDAAFAGLLFGIPSALLSKPSRKGSDYFLRN